MNFSIGINRKLTKATIIMDYVSYYIPERVYAAFYATVKPIPLDNILLNQLQKVTWSD